MKRASSVFIFGWLFASSAAFFCAPAAAQDAPDLAALELTAQKRSLEWEALAKDMNDRMARILPCDPRALAAVNEVSRASEARLSALADYLRAVSAKAFTETADARNLLSAEERRAVEIELERNDSDREQTAVDTDSDALAQSVKQRTSLEAPQKVLAQISALIHQRAQTTEPQVAAANAAVALLRDLVAKFDARDAALREEFAASEAERARWNGYYAARRARAQIECSITQIGGTPPRGKR